MIMIQVKRLEMERLLSRAESFHAVDLNDARQAPHSLPTLTYHIDLQSIYTISFFANENSTNITPLLITLTESFDYTWTPTNTSKTRTITAACSLSVACYKSAIRV